jgi:hypothetical protein
MAIMVNDYYIILFTKTSNFLLSNDKAAEIAMTHQIIMHRFKLFIIKFKGKASITLLFLIRAKINIKQKYVHLCSVLSE